MLLLAFVVRLQCQSMWTVAVAGIERVAAARDRRTREESRVVLLALTMKKRTLEQQWHMERMREGDYAV